MTTKCARGWGGGGESTQKCHQVLKLCESKKIKLECVCVGGGGGRRMSGKLEVKTTDFHNNP